MKGLRIYSNKPMEFSSSGETFMKENIKYLTESSYTC